MSEQQNAAPSGTSSNPTNFSPLIWLILVIAGCIWYFWPKIDTSWAVDEACTKVKSVVYSELGEVAKVSGDLIYKDGKNYIIAVQYTLPGHDYTASYACLVYGTRKSNCYVSEMTREMSYNYNYKGHLSELKALWELE